MTDRKTVYSGDYIERLGELRTDRKALAEAFRHPATRFVPVWQERCLVDVDRPAMLARGQVGTEALDPDQAIFLGRCEERYLFAVCIESKGTPALPTDAEFLGLRELTTMLAEPDAALLAYAKAMVGWQQRHRYCGLCGSDNIALDGGFIMACADTRCGHRSFPRLDPAVIVLVHRENRCLLGRQRLWPERRFSTIAGFVEPGESLEDAVRREVREETNIAVGRCEYRASQPWPFPSALMIGYHAEALSQDIRLNDGELAEARWLRREDIASGSVVLPPEFSVAYRLIESWFNRGAGRPLAEHDLPDLPFRSRGPALRG